VTAFANLVRICRLAGFASYRFDHGLCFGRAKRILLTAPRIGLLIGFSLAAVALALLFGKIHLLLSSNLWLGRPRASLCRCMQAKGAA